MSNIDSNIAFDAFGYVREDFSEDELAAIGTDENRRDRFVALVEADRGAKSPKRMHADAVQHGKELLELRDKQIAARNKAFPPVTAHQAHLAVIAATKRE